MQVTPYPLVSPKARVALGSGAGSGSQTQWIGMLAGERSIFSLKRPSFYTKEIAWFKDFRRFSVSFVIVYPHTVRLLRSGDFGARTLLIGGVRDFSGAFVFSLNFGAAKDMLGAPRRNVLQAETLFWCLARNDAILGCFITNLKYFRLCYLSLCLF